MNTNTIRQIALDTETTGMNRSGKHYEGHKIIEIGAVEMINRRLTGNNFHVYLKPDRSIDPEAFSIHGISDEFLLNKPTFAEIANEFINYIKGAELIIHNAIFDIEFINYEFSKLHYKNLKIESFCKIIDSLLIARKIFPGKRNSLDMLCSRYGINKTKRRNFHGALLDAQILADIYLFMTGGQTSMIFITENTAQQQTKNNTYISTYMTEKFKRLRVILANDKELINHELYLDLMQKKYGICIWRNNFSKKTT